VWPQSSPAATIAETATRCVRRSRPAPRLRLAPTRRARAAAPAPATLTRVGDAQRVLHQRPGATMHCKQCSVRAGDLPHPAVKSDPDAAEEATPRQNQSSSASAPVWGTGGRSSRCGSRARFGGSGVRLRIATPRPHCSLRARLEPSRHPTEMPMARMGGSGFRSR